MEHFSVSLPLTGEYLTTVRLTTGGLCALVGFDVDLAEDYKVCVTESLLILKRNGYLRADICFTVGETLACTVCGVDKNGTKEGELEDEISRALLSALLGKVDFVQGKDGDVEKIEFEG
ncbi:MAG: hypothetical protein IJX91_05200 [Clostridia bacterium]|nr:hypothetical protein [Clostridia bacterium]